MSIRDLLTRRRLWEDGGSNERGASMRGYLGKLEIKSVREGEGKMPMQFAVPGKSFKNQQVQGSRRNFIFGQVSLHLRRTGIVSLCQPTIVA